jgi:hypothetical protein
MPKVFDISWDWESVCWKVVLTDGRHTWIGKSMFLSIAYLIAFGRFTFDTGRWE